ncbi:Methylated-DNA--protein-cysteine methyltransferase, constitutive [Polystyrenella longa]|uniref:methylated-DNA--[protein]-cysteine S-methyltransferase n=1 Tax=Polystyrenella longa TaxID=2528007 RepID=A0A518CQH0_9PLAN|nr:MGMT family protein [Polystyrenella longa]QDU81450.1 Methylated-DNA--protein-cysteine methyltransferase, constitutive [Polystyrenella longa]
MLNYNVFDTDLGYWGFAGRDHQVQAVVIGHETEQSAADSLLEKVNRYEFVEAEFDDWYPELRRDLQKFAAGEMCSFEKVDLLLPEKLTHFQRKVLTQTRQLQYGQTITYQDLAERAGHPGAARAVGSVMANNLIPILIPCHRVLGTGRKLGGFSAPQGTLLKRDLLRMEDPALAVLL